MLTLSLLALTLSGAPLSVYDFSMKSIDGKDVSLSAYKGKAVMIVNTASQCGYTPQYKGLEALYQQYKDQGFTILAFPSNDFGGQEPGSNEEIKKFCELKFKTSFPMFAKIPVKGDAAHPLYKYLGEVAWNFNKFLISTDGKVVAHLPSKAEPTSDEVKKQVEALLPKK